MLNVTRRARAELHGMLAQGLSPELPGKPLGFRLISCGGERFQLGLRVDEPHPGDEVFDLDGLTVLIVDHSTSELLGDLTLDAIEAPEGVRLEFRS